MRELAAFERNIKHFHVTQDDLLDYGFGDTPRFGVFLAEREEKIVGIAVHYRIPWTYDMRPIVVLKELFVSDQARGIGAGRALFQRLLEHASDIGASAVRWTVLRDNDDAKRFYASVGGVLDVVWEPWEIRLPVAASVKTQKQ